MRRVRVPLAPRRVRWGVVLAVGAAVFVTSVVVEPDGTAEGVLGPHWDALLHALAYATLAFALAYATADWRGGPCRRPVAVFVATAGYGLLIELAQTLVPYRQFSLLDVAANAAGALLVMGWFALETRLQYRRVGHRGPGGGSQPRREE